MERTLKGKIMKYHYLVCYFFKGNGSWGFGNTEHIVTEPILTIENIREISKMIESEFAQNNQEVVILNFQLLRTE